MHRFTTDQYGTIRTGGPFARPSGREWTNPNVQAWVSTNKAPKNERQAYARFLAHVGLKMR